MWDILWMSCLSGLATPLGAVLVIRYYNVLIRMQGLFWGIAAGIMATLVVVELMPSAIQIGGSRLFFVTAGIGSLLMFTLRRAMMRASGGRTRSHHEVELLRMGWFVAAAIALHDLPEGMAIAAGGAVKSEMGIIIACAIALHNIPEGMSIAFPLSLAGVRRKRIFTLSLWIGLVTPLGTLASIWVVHVSNTFIASSLALASGTMLYVVSQDILPEALQQGRVQALAGAALGGLLMFGLSTLRV